MSAGARRMRYGGPAAPGGRRPVIATETAWIGVTCTDDRLRGLHRRHYSSEKSGRRRGRPVEHPSQLRMIGPVGRRLPPDVRAWMESQGVRFEPWGRGKRQ